MFERARIAVVGTSSFRDMRAVKNALMQAVGECVDPAILLQPTFNWSSLFVVHFGTGGPDLVAVDYAQQLGMSIEHIALPLYVSDAQALRQRNIRLLESGNRVDRLITFKRGNSARIDDLVATAQRKGIRVIQSGERSDSREVRELG